MKRLSLEGVMKRQLAADAIFLYLIALLYLGQWDDLVEKNVRVLRKGFCFISTDFVQ